MRTSVMTHARELSRHELLAVAGGEGETEYTPEFLEAMGNCLAEMTDGPSGSCLEVIDALSSGTAGNTTDSTNSAPAPNIMGDPVPGGYSTDLDYMSY